MIAEWLKTNQPKKGKTGQTGIKKDKHTFRGKFKSAYSDEDGEWFNFINVECISDKSIEIYKTQSIKLRLRPEKNTWYEFEANFRSDATKRRNLANVKIVI